MASIFIPAKGLQIVDVNDPPQWKWYYDSEISQDVAQLEKDTVLDISGETGTSQLKEPPYGVYFVFKLTSQPKPEGIDQALGAAGTKFPLEDYNLISLTTGQIIRPDGWYEVELGVYNGGSEKLYFGLKGIDTTTLKSGLIVRGVEVRPLRQ